jgi:hypothetical protein
MALQTSGPISFTDIQTEFGGENPISLSEYYGAADGIPASGAIALNGFYGKSSIIPKIEDIGLLEYKAARSYTGDAYPITRYGRGLFVANPDGTEIVFVYMDYNYHYFHHVNLSTPWDFSTMQAVDSSQYLNPNNHYQGTLASTSDGTKYIFGGYSNGLSSGWGYHYTTTQGTGFTVGGSLASYYSPRYGMTANEALHLLAPNDEGTKYFMSTAIDSGNVKRDHHAYIREYSTSNFDLSSSASTQVNYLDLRAFLGISSSSMYASGTGSTVQPWCVNRAGTQILISHNIYENGNIRFQYFRTIDLPTPWSLTGATLGTGVIDMKPIGTQYSSNIQHVQYGKDGKELVFLVGNGSYGTANGVKGKWLTFAEYVPVPLTLLDGTTNQSPWVFDDEYPENTGTTNAYGYKESTGLRIYAPYWGSGSFYLNNINLTGKRFIRLKGRWVGCAHYCNANVGFPSTNGTNSYSIRVTGSPADGTFDVTLPITGTTGNMRFSTGNTAGGSVYLDMVEAS